MNYRDVMFVAPDDVKTGTYVNLNVDDATIAPAIRETQDVWLQSIIGTRLYDALGELVLNQIEGREDSIDSEGNEHYKALLDDYCIPFINAKVQAVLCLPDSYPTRNLGVVHPSDQNLNAEQQNNILKLQQRYNATADRYATLLSMWLCKNRKLFPELGESACCGGDLYQPQLGKRFVHTGLWLDYGNGNPCC